MDVPVTDRVESNSTCPEKMPPEYHDSEDDVECLATMYIAPNTTGPTVPTTTAIIGLITRAAALTTGPTIRSDSTATGLWHERVTPNPLWDPIRSNLGDFMWPEQSRPSRFVLHTVLHHIYPGPPSPRQRQAREY